MRYLIVVKGGVYSSQAHFSAIHFCHHLVAKNHIIEKVFFLQSGVEVANDQVALLDDEFDALAHWKVISEKNNIPLFMCLSAAERRGVIALESADRISQNEKKIKQLVSIAGLAEMHDACMTADRVMTFH